MEKFTRFENQYIFMLAARARESLLKDLEEQKVYTQLDPNMKDYVDALESIAHKAMLNMRELAKVEEK